MLMIILHIKNNNDNIRGNNNYDKNDKKWHTRIANASNVEISKNVREDHQLLLVLKKKLVKR